MSPELPQDEVDALLRGLDMCDCDDEEYENREIPLDSGGLSFQEISEYPSQRKLQFKSRTEKRDERLFLWFSWILGEHINDELWESNIIELNPRTTKKELECVVNGLKVVARQTFQSGKWKGIDEGSYLARKKMRQSLGIEK